MLSHAFMNVAPGPLNSSPLVLLEFSDLQISAEDAVRRKTDFKLVGCLCATHEELANQAAVSFPADFAAEAVFIMTILKSDKVRQRCWVSGRFKMAVIEICILEDAIVPKVSLAQRGRFY